MVFRKSDRIVLCTVFGYYAVKIISVVFVETQNFQHVLVFAVYLKMFATRKQHLELVLVTFFQFASGLSTKYYCPIKRQLIILPFL